MKLDIDDFRVPAGKKVDLEKWATRVDPVYESKQEYEKHLRKQVEELSALQQLHYASNRYAVLLIFQAMDAAGKDGAIRHVMSGVNPQGCQVFSGRYRSIVQLEKHLHRNGTRIVKFFLHLSADEQRKRFLDRIDEPEKNWKFSLADVHERAFWKDYMKAYEACLSATSSKQAPWYVVPADDKENARLIIAEIVVELFKGLKLAYPKLSDQRLRELQEIRQGLAK